MKRKDFQTELAMRLRMPLQIADGKLDSDYTDLGIKTYHKQYWFRLFTCFQSEFPLVAALLGPWKMNRLAEGFLLECPPISFDLARAADGFANYLSTHSQKSIREASHIDEAWRQLFRQKKEPAWRPSIEQTTRLSELQLKRSEQVLEIAESYPLIEYRRRLLEKQAAELGPEYKRSQTWLLFRDAEGYGTLRLEWEQQRLLTLLAEHSVADAVKTWGKEFPEISPGHVQGWLAESMKIAYWCDGI